MNLYQHIWLAVCWMIFGVLHSILATSRVKNIMQTILQQNFKFYRSAYSILSAIIIAYTLFLNFSIISVLIWQPPMIEKFISVVTGLTGLIIMSFCIRKYFFDLSGISVFFKKSAQDHLQVDGLNKYVRHPLYAATLLFVGSFFFWQPSLSNFISCMGIFLYTLIGIYFEERKLIKAFGNDYKEYAAKVPMIIPLFI